ncbi:MAG: 4Fe-4S binding protein [Synergistaceae bacterium]|nr:4Fe-4S binding protein [Synergistaceae bacterium]
MLQNSFYIRINAHRCRGCTKCIRRCPTEAMRGTYGQAGIDIIERLCIGCGECIRECPYKAIELVQDDWETIRAQGNLALLADPTFHVQVGHCNRTGFIISALKRIGFEDMTESISLAFDVSAYAIAKRLASGSKAAPLISSYCPAIVRYIRKHHPELINNIVDVDSPYETAAEYYRMSNPDASMALIAQCPAVSNLINSPVGRDKSNFSHVINIRQVVKGLLASGERIDDLPPEIESGARWLAWAASGGECRHISAFSEKKINTMVVTGMENISTLLHEVELGRLSCIDFIECRACYKGCVGGVSASESRYLSLSRIDSLKIDWNISTEERAKLERLYDEGKWRLSKCIEPLPEQAPLSNDISVAVSRLKELKNLHASLPGFDCGSCGRPSCHAMAEDIVRKHGEITDCIFKLREKITLLSSEMNELCMRKTSPL